MFDRIHEILEDFTPDAFLVLGDTNSCLTAYVAKRLQIPIFHVEAGNRCFDQRVPEEINRRIVDHTADINLTYSSIAREYLLREGLPPDQIIKTGQMVLIFRGDVNQLNQMPTIRVQSRVHCVILCVRHLQFTKSTIQQIIISWGPANETGSHAHQRQGHDGQTPSLETRFLKRTGDTLYGIHHLD